jgi:tRNA A37 methylthiotransferase MiaB
MTKKVFSKNFGCQMNKYHLDYMAGFNMVGLPKA